MKMFKYEYRYNDLMHKTDTHYDIALHQYYQQIINIINN